MRDRPGSLAVPPFGAAKRLTVPDPKRSVTNGGYPLFKIRTIAIIVFQFRVVAGTP